MAIGNAPWPIGVTMVGIHARGGRDNIMSNKVAHVMNDEMMRKYVNGAPLILSLLYVMNNHPLSLTTLH